MSIFEKSTGLLNNIVQNVGKEINSIASTVKPETTVRQPLINIVETSDSIEMHISTLGLKKEDLHISIDNDSITVSNAEHLNNPNKQTRKYLLHEFNLTQFSRSFKIPESVDQSLISAAFKEGLMLILLPKKDEFIQQSGRKIDII